MRNQVHLIWVDAVSQHELIIDKYIEPALVGARQKYKAILALCTTGLRVYQLLLRSVLIPHLIQITRSGLPVE